MENNMRKSDENDAMLLARIPKEKFRPLAIKELELKMQMKPLINKYEQIMKWKKILKGLMSRGFNYNFEEALKLMEKIGRNYLRRSLNK